MKKRMTIIIVAVAVLALVALTGCGGGGGNYGAPANTPAAGGSGSGGASGGSGGGATAGGTTVNESGFAFDPSSLEVKVGDTVTFTNQDSAGHNVEIDGKSLGDQGQGASVTWKADKAGTFPYKCTIHPSMTGQIVVK